MQPKRWEKADNPKYDPIRHKPWFNRLLKRKKVIPLMEGCYLQSKNPDCPHRQEELCDLWNVSPREFRDYCSFLDEKVWPEVSPVFQSILDKAYGLYCDSNAEFPIQRFIQNLAPHYGKNYRHVWELWEVSPVFYPNDYPYRN